MVFCSTRIEPMNSDFKQYWCCQITSSVCCVNNFDFKFHVHLKIIRKFTFFTLRYLCRSPPGRVYIWPNYVFLFWRVLWRRAPNYTCLCYLLLCRIEKPKFNMWSLWPLASDTIYCHPVCCFCKVWKPLLFKHGLFPPPSITKKTLFTCDCFY